MARTLRFHTGQAIAVHVTREFRLCIRFVGLDPTRFAFMVALYMSPIRRCPSAWFSLLLRRCSALSCFAHRSNRDALGISTDVVCVPLVPRVDGVDDANSAVCVLADAEVATVSAVARISFSFPWDRKDRPSFRPYPDKRRSVFMVFDGTPSSFPFGKGIVHGFQRDRRPGDCGLGGSLGIFVVYFLWRTSEVVRGSEQRGSKHTRRRRAKRTWVEHTADTRKRRVDTDGNVGV